MIADDRFCDGSGRTARSNSSPLRLGLAVAIHRRQPTVLLAGAVLFNDYQASGAGRYIVLHADSVSNDGTITANGGTDFTHVTGTSPAASAARACSSTRLRARWPWALT